MAKTDYGFSLVELLVVIGLMSATAIAVGSMTSYLFRGTRSVALSQQEDSLVNEVDLALNSKDLCKAALVPTPVFPAGWSTYSKVSEIDLGSPIVKVGAINDGVKTNSIQLTKIQGPFPIKVNTTPNGPSPTIVDMNRYFIRIDIQDQKTGMQTNVGGDLMKSKAFFISASVDSTGKLYDCYGGMQKDFFQELCERELGGTYDESKNPSCLVPRMVVSNTWSSWNSPAPYLLVQNNDVAPAGTQAVAAFTAPKHQADVVIQGDGEASPGTYAALVLADASNTHTWSMSLERGGPAPYSVSIDKYAGGMTTHALTIDYSSLNVDIGASAPTADRLNVEGNFRTAGNAVVTGNILTGGTVTAASDRRLKRDIRPLESVLDRVLKLQPVRFRFKKSAGNGDSKREHIGFIAQDVEKLFPEFVYTDSNGMKSIAYAEFSAVLARSLQELSEQQRAEERESDQRIRLLSQRLDDMNQRIKKLEASLSARKRR